MLEFNMFGCLDGEVMLKKISWPLALTWFRVFMVPVFIGIYYIPDFVISMPIKNYIATGVFVVASATDYLDGYLARKLNQVSSFGAFLDPVADKAIVAASLVVLVSLQRTFMFAAIIIILREIAVSALREWMAQVGQTGSVAVAYIGKLKTSLQMLAITLLIYDNHTRFLGNIIMLLAVLITIISMLYYLKQAKNYVNN
jgi:cardiolipin synthase (CMP-forming)